MKDIYELARKLNRLIGYEPGNRDSPEICANESFNEMKSFPFSLTRGHLYLYVPSSYKDGHEDYSMQEAVKKEIMDYVKENELRFLVATQGYCGHVKCHGHIIDPSDPIDLKRYKDHVFVDEFPNEISGASVYFFTEENFRKYKQITEILCEDSQSDLVIEKYAKNKEVYDP